MSYYQCLNPFFSDLCVCLFACLFVVQLESSPSSAKFKHLWTTQETRHISHWIISERLLKHFVNFSDCFTEFATKIPRNTRALLLYDIRFVEHRIIQQLTKTSPSGEAGNPILLVNPPEQSNRLRCHVKENCQICASNTTQEPKFDKMLVSWH